MAKLRDKGLQSIYATDSVNKCLLHTPTIVNA